MESITTKLAQISAQMFGVQMKSQASIDKIVEEFWRQFCYERDEQGVSLTQPSPGTWRRYRRDWNNQDETAQQDPHEFLMWMMKTMEDRLVHAATPTAAGERYDWFFKSRLVPRVTCKRCKYPVRQRRPRNTESATCLMLELPQTSQNSAHQKVAPTLLLKDLVDDFMHERLPNLVCERCKEQGGCTRQKQFQHAPALLIIAISRITATLQKNTTAVMIPDQLDVSKHLNAHEFGEGSRVTYSLSSVVSHVGRETQSGHYVSYVRGGKLRDEWAELNDRVVTQKVLSDFDESRATDLGKSAFKSRPTPYILFYERNYATDNIIAGREAMNVGKKWTGTEVDWVKGANEKNEKKFPPAVLQVTVTIGEIEIKLPPHVISHLDWKKRRTVEIDARLRIPKGERKRVLEQDYKEVSLSDIQNQEYYLEQRQREGEGEPAQKKRKTWRDNWQNVTRDSTDLTLEEIQMVADVSGATEKEGKKKRRRRK